MVKKENTDLIGWVPQGTLDSFLDHKNEGNVPIPETLKGIQIRMGKIVKHVNINLRTPVFIKRVAWSDEGLGSHFLFFHST